MLIKKIINSLFPKTSESIFQDGINSGILKEQKSNQEQQTESRNITFEYTHKIDSYIIAVPNEYDDIIVGQITRHGYIGRSPVAYVYDYIRKEELLLLQKPFIYSESFAECISNLDPQNRHILIYGRKKNFTGINEETLVGWDNVKKTLTENGFFLEINK